MSKVNTHFKKNVWWYLLGSGVGSWLVVVIPGPSWWHGLLFGLIVVVAVGCACRVRSVRVLLVFSIVISIPVLVLPLLSYFWVDPGPVEVLPVTLEKKEKDTACSPKGGCSDFYDVWAVDESGHQWVIRVGFSYWNSLELGDRTTLTVRDEAILGGLFNARIVTRLGSESLGFGRFAEETTLFLLIIAILESAVPLSIGVVRIAASVR